MKPRPVRGFSSPPSSNPPDDPPSRVDPLPGHARAFLFPRSSLHVKLITAAIAAGALLCAFGAQSAIKSTKVDAPAVVLKRGSTTITPAPLDMIECEARKIALMALDGETKQSGSGVYDCLYIQRTRVAFGRNPPPPTCTVPRPAVEGRSMQCPAPLVGTWTQTREYVPAAYPVCWTPAEWTPASAPPGICATPPRTARLTWTPRTQNTDGTPLKNLAGYRILYGASTAAMSRTIDIPNPGVTSYVVDQLSPATWFFAVKAYTTTGKESDPSNVESKVIP